MSRSHHSREFYEEFDKRRSDVRESKRARRVRKRKREEERKRRATFEKYGYLAYGSCTRKRRFNRLSNAKKWQRWHPQYKNLSIYKCELCGGWHFTSHPLDKGEDIAQTQDVVSN